METFTLSRKELHRPGLLKVLCGGRPKNWQVAAALGLTVRQVRRLRRRFERARAAALAHANRVGPRRGACRRPSQGVARSVSTVPANQHRRGYEQGRSDNKNCPGDAARLERRQVESQGVRYPGVIRGRGVCSSPTSQ
jgi:hypothetical protein